MKHLLHRVLATTLVLLSLQMALHAYDNYYVKSTATGAGDGSSWTDAFTSLQVAIDLAVKGDVICVAAGTYFPSFVLVGGEPRLTTFYIDKDVIIYGGFSGEPGTEGDLESRDPLKHVTVLSGDIGVLGDRNDNAFHVVYFDHVSDTARLDGFTITHGNSLDGEGASGFHTYGAGIYNDANAGRSHPTIANCIVRDNRSSQSGGGMMNLAQEGGQANPLILNCVFSSNSASGAGAIAALTEDDGVISPTLINCKFTGNTGRTAGGGALQFIAHGGIAAPKIINCVVFGNHAPTSEAINIVVSGTGVSTPQLINCAFSGNTGGSIRISDLGTAHTSKITARNSIFYGNGSGAGISGGLDPDLQFCITEFFSFPGSGNITENPGFVNQPVVPVDAGHEIGDLHLMGNSPAIDAGFNAAVPAGTTTDTDGNPRFINPGNGLAGTVDIGPYEFQGSTTGISGVIADAEWNVFPNPAVEIVNVKVSPVLSHGNVSMYDLQGRLIESQSLNPGQIEVCFNINTHMSGVYLIQLNRDGKSATRKINISK